MTATSTMSPSRWAYEPFVELNATQVARLRDFFMRSRFTEPDICGVAGLATLYELPRLQSRSNVLTDVSDPQALLVQLFVDGITVPWDLVRSTLSPNDITLLVELGLLQTSIIDAGDCTASVALYPTEGLYLASDKHAAIESVAEGVPADIVYSAMTPETHRFIDLMPRSRCVDYLELCSGTGIAALLAARDFAEHAWAIDIADRSTRFARYNSSLNGLRNVTALTGDLYEPVAGRTFDLIVAHPPYVPSFETEMIFRDGGEDGEQVTRRIIAGLSDHLRPGGHFHGDCMMTDRVDAPVETRIRAMLGPAEGQFDILAGQVETVDIEGILQRLGRTQELSAGELERRRSALEALGVERFVKVAFLIHRRERPGTVVTVRRIVSSETSAAHFQSYMRWLVATSTLDGDLTALLDSRPRRASGIEFHSRSVSDETGWRPAEGLLVTLVPFALEANCPMWFATLLAKCDGRTTAREHLQHLRDAGVVSAGASDADFARLIGQLADGGFIEFDSSPFVA